MNGDETVAGGLLSAYERSSAPRSPAEREQP